MLPSSPRGLTGVKTRLLSAWVHASDLNVSDLVIETWQRVSHSLRSLRPIAHTRECTTDTIVLKVPSFFVLPTEFPF